MTPHLSVFLPLKIYVGSRIGYSSRSRYTHHLLYLEHDELQRPLEVRHLNNLGLVPRWPRERHLPCLAHGS